MLHTSPFILNTTNLRDLSKLCTIFTGSIGFFFLSNIFLIFRNNYIYIKKHFFFGRGGGVGGRGVWPGCMVDFGSTYVIVNGLMRKAPYLPL